ncbi:MAG: Small GTP-binding domain protein [Promethearchaeota archaeon]|nr:MAG: Small GTP-binding domain protein [Candidatus Lokiarchaeota archaeon]
MLQINILDQLLENFLSKVPELSAVLVVDLDGLIIAQKSVKGFDEEIIGAIMSILEQTISKIKRFAETSYGSGTFDTNEFRLFYLELGGALFVLVADPYSDIEKFIPYSYLVAEKVSLLLNNRDPSISLPELNKAGHGIKKPKNGSLDNKVIFNQILLIGSRKVGKSSLLSMYIKGEPVENYKPTIGASFIEKDLKLTNRIKLKFYIFDLSGIKAFAKVRRFLYPQTDAVIFLFDYTNEESLTQVTEWIEEARHFIKEKDIPYVLAGNKIDLVEDRASLRGEAQKLADQYNCAFFEISALTGQGVDELFTHLISGFM